MSDKIDLERKVVKFKCKPTKSGPRYYFNIPLRYIKDGLIDPKQEYIVYLGPFNKKNKEN